MRHIHRATCSLIENMYNQTTCFYIIPHFAQPNYPRESSFLFVCVLFIMYELLNVISVACKISASLCSLFIWRQIVRLIANRKMFHVSAPCFALFLCFPLCLVENTQGFSDFYSSHSYIILYRIHIHIFYRIQRMKTIFWAT